VTSKNKKVTGVLQMKRISLILFSVIMLVSLTSCSKSSQISGPGSGTLGSYKAKIESYVLTKDTYGKDAVIINYTWANDSKKDISFITAITDKVYQNGVECKRAIITDDSVYHGYDSLKNVKRGDLLQVQLAYVLQDIKNPISVELMETASKDSNAPKVTQTFNLS
jgi:hypothetical protein